MKIKILNENKGSQATSEHFQKLLRLARKKDVETDEQVLNILKGISQVGLISDENKEAAKDLYYYYLSRKNKAEEQKKGAQVDHDFWVARNKSNIQDLSGQINKAANKLDEWTAVAKVAAAVVSLFADEELYEEKSYIDPPKKKTSYETRWVIAVLEDDMTGETREQRVKIPMEFLQQADKVSAHLPPQLQGEAFDNEVMNYLDQFMQEFELIGWTEHLMDYRPGDPGDSFDTNPKPKPYVKDSEFDMIEEAKEDDVKEKYGLKDGEMDGRQYPHMPYNQIVHWVNRDRPKRIKLLDWMGKQIAGTDWRDTEAMTLVFNMTILLDKFLKAQNQFKEKDINKYPNLEAVKQAYKTDVQDPIVGKVRKGRRMPGEADGDVVYQDDRFFVVHPKTTEASCYYGAKTKWCISQKNNPYFKTYSDAGKVFYMVRDDTKKNNDPFYAMTVQLRKPSGKVEALWDRFDNKYDSDAWPSGEYGEESEEAIMSAIKAHFENNYKAGASTIPMFVASLNEGKFDKKIDYRGGMLYLKWEAKLSTAETDDKDYMTYQANYTIDYEDPYAVPRRKMGKTWRRYSDEMLNNAFEAGREQIIKNTAAVTGFKTMKLEYNGTGYSEPGRILLYFSQPGRETGNVDNAFYFVSSLSEESALQEAGFDVLDEFIDQWEHFMDKGLKSQTAEPLSENKKRIRVVIK